MTTLSVHGCVIEYKHLLNPTHQVEVHVPLPNQSEALAALANDAAIFEWDHDQFIRRYDRVLALDPSHVRALSELAIASTVYQIEPSPELDQKVLGLIALLVWLAGLGR